MLNTLSMQYLRFAINSENGCGAAVLKITVHLHDKKAVETLWK